MNKTSLSPHLPILLGVSGGADSLCLLGTLHEAGYPLIIAHFDHQLRPDSAKDAQFVRKIAEQYKLPFLTESRDVAAYAKKHQQSIEEAARNLRYKFLFEQARKHKAQAVAVGHTADDQVETVLMHFLRGAGLSGLKGIEEGTILPHFDPEIPLVRPILRLWRAETVAYCEAHKLDYHEDPSNASDDFFRNRLRHNLIPELEKYNPRFREVLQRTSHALQGDYALISELTRSAWKKSILAEGEDYISFQLDPFFELSPALIRNIIKLGMEKLLRGQLNISFSILDSAARFIASSQSAQRIDLASGLMLLKEGDALHLTFDVANLPLGDFPQMSGDVIPLTFPLKPVSFENGWVLTAKRTSTAPKLKKGNPFQVTLDAEALGQNLSLRTRRAGERIYPLGMFGKSMKVKDFMINVKLPKRARENYPILYAGDEAAWIPGYQPSHLFRVVAETKSFISFEVVKLAE
ncbi:MAG TPA: tRNA lysidine(34) synthetase TilS [Anaerolineales bacterium]|nr:tRNA lysidine(34) synthetase TilS [Anaerolineales bacterium]